MAFLVMLAEPIPRRWETKWKLQQKSDWVIIGCTALLLVCVKASSLAAASGITT